MAITGAHMLLDTTEPEALRAQGVVVKGEPDDQGWGITVTLDLPGGTALTFYEPRHAVAASQ